MKFGTDIFGVWSINLDFSDDITFQLAPLQNKVFVYPVNYLHVYKIVLVFIWCKFQVKMNCNNYGDLITFCVASSSECTLFIVLISKHS